VVCLGSGKRVASLVDGGLRLGEFAHGGDARVEKLARRVLDRLRIEVLWHGGSVSLGASSKPAAPETMTSADAKASDPCERRA
jgi:hypothetical protein